VSKHKIFGNRWECVIQINEGGQSWIYDVRDLQHEFKGKLVLKKLKNIKRFARFENEIKAVQKLEHPGIPKILDFSLKDKPFFVTEFIEGKTLDEVSPRPLTSALQIFENLCAVVEYSHSQGIIHRDLKPDNVLWDSKEETVHVIDFGLAYAEDSEGRLTETMEQVGSRFYMAPEVEAGRAEDVSPTADVYALGKILYFLLTGRHVAREDFMGDNEISKVTGDDQAMYLTKKVFRAAIAVDPSKRLSATKLRQEVLNVQRLIHEHFYPGKAGSKCRFCGEGRYKGVGIINFEVYRTGKP
jgi:serine/threonine protein kinase